MAHREKLMKWVTTLERAEGVNEDIEVAGGQALRGRPDHGRCSAATEPAQPANARRRAQ
jgi:hypothetical protein